jgi:hypothetical protein
MQNLLASRSSGQPCCKKVPSRISAENGLGLRLTFTVDFLLLVLLQLGLSPSLYFLLVSLASSSPTMLFCLVSATLAFSALAAALPTDYDKRASESLLPSTHLDRSNSFFRISSRSRSHLPCWPICSEWALRAKLSPSCFADLLLFGIDSKCASCSTMDPDASACSASAGVTAW